MKMKVKSPLVGAAAEKGRASPAGRGTVVVVDVVNVMLFSVALILMLAFVHSLVVGIGKGQGIEQRSCNKEHEHEAFFSFAESNHRYRF